MNKADISKTNLYLTNLINVLSSQLTDQKSIHVDGRHSDAFVFVTTGSCTYTFADDHSQLTVQKGDILYLAHNAIYTMDIHTNKYQSIYCDFQFDTASPRKSMIYRPANISFTENLFLRLMSTSRSASASAFSDCMFILYNIYSVIQETANTKYTEPGVKHHISQAHKYITENFKDESLSVSQLAETAGMSEVYFRRLFKAQYGLSPARYITSVRLKKAKELMKYPFLTINDCALQSGFSSLQYFCRVFKSATGMTPSQYRKQKDKT